MAKESLKIKNINITNSGPLVIIGPNGAGKSRLGVAITQTNPNSDRISAKRVINPPENFSFNSEDQVKKQYEQSKNQFKQDLYKYSSEFTSLLMKLFAEETSASIRFKEEFLKAENKADLKVPETTLSKIQSLWKEVFPKRELLVEKSKIQVRSTLHSEKATTYGANQLSDGELVSFYMIARVLDSNASILIIDEPEIHLHPYLAKTLWSTLEDAKPDVRFVYITHDYTFAESRREANYLVVRPGAEPELLKENCFPPEFLHLLLGAVSADIKVDRIVFCEGPEGGKDDQIYSSWFDSTKVKVIPVGGCDRVRACFEAINSGKIINSLKAVGIVDRDFRTEDEIQELTKLGLHVLPIHELESILGIEGVFISLAEYLGRDKDLAKKNFDEFQLKCKAALAPISNKVILERSKRLALRKAQGLINASPCDSNFSVMNEGFNTNISQIHKEISPQDLMSKENSELGSAINNSWDKTLEFYPGKPIFSKAEEVLGTSGTVLVTLIEKALRIDDSKYTDLKKSLEHELIKIFPAK